MSLLDQIHIAYSIPIYWILGGAVSFAAMAVQIWTTFKTLIQRVDRAEKEIELLKEVREDVAYIRGKIDKL